MYMQVNQYTENTFKFVSLSVWKYQNINFKQGKTKRQKEQSTSIVLWFCS